MTEHIKFFMGVEIEVETNREKIDINRGEYHNGVYFNKYFTAERDGSLDGDKFDDSKCVEFVTSKLIRTKKSFFNVLKYFQKSIVNRSHETKLNKVLNFNDTMGCHIHIGTNQREFYKTICYDKLVEVRELFFEMVNKSEKLSKETKNLVLEHYFREHSKKIKNTSTLGYDRYTEFNIYSEESGRGLEWRSFNLNGVKSWCEFFTLFEICYECLSLLMRYKKEGYVLKTETIRLPKEELKQIIESNTKETIQEISGY